jgi:hypothetical protein
VGDAQRQGVGYGDGGSPLSLDTLEAGSVHLDGSYPAALEREGFVGSSTAYSPLQQLPASPEFELKAVGSSGGAAAAAPRDKAGLLGGGSSGGLLAVTAASGSGRLLPAASSGASLLRNASVKQKVSPIASLDRDMARRLADAAAAGGDGSDGQPQSVRATRRHPSISSETMA